MQPGLPRALPMGIMGFLLGAALVIVLRSLQSMDPIWDPQIGLVMAGFMAAGFFVWGIGAFNPKLSEHHAHAPEEFELVPAGHHDHHEEEPAAPMALLSQQMWQITFWSILLLVIIFGFATIPNGFFVRTTGDALGSTGEVGFFTMDVPVLGELVFSELTFFILLALFIFASLGAVGGGLAMLFFNLSRNVAEAKTTRPADQAALPAGEGTAVVPAKRNAVKVNLGAGRVIMAIVVAAVLYFLLLNTILPGLLAAVGTAIGNDAPAGLALSVLTVPLAAVLALMITHVLFWREIFVQNPGKYLIAAVVVVVLYLVFYYALIGLVVGAESPLNIPLSIVNALLVVFVLFWSPVFVRLIGMAARFGVRVLRGVPAFLGQK